MWASFQKRSGFCGGDVRSLQNPCASGGSPWKIILFLDKMVNTILSCESFAGRRWRREMYGLTFFAATPLAAETAAE